MKRIVTDLDSPLGMIPFPENLILKKGVVGGMRVRLSENLDLLMIWTLILWDLFISNPENLTILGTISKIPLSPVIL